MKFQTILSLLLLIAQVARAHDPEAQLPFERPHAHDDFGGHLHAGWESRYFSEGRDALDGESIWASSLELGWEHVAAGFWYGRSADQDYDEVQISLALVQSFAEFEFYAGYTHLRFPFADMHDNELGAGFTWSGLPAGLELSVDAYYSFDAEGYFSEFTLSRELEITEKLSLEASGLFGLNQGYVSDGHDGVNHLAARLGAEYKLTESLSLTAHATYSWAIDADSRAPGDEQLIDFFHGSIGLQWSF